YAISAAATSYAGKFGGHHAQDLIAGFVAIGVVEVLEVIDVNDCNRVWFFETQQSVIKGAARWKRGQFVVVGQKIRVFDDGTDKDQARCGQIRSGSWGDCSDLERKKGRQQSLQQTALRWLAIEYQAHQQNCQSRDEGQQGQ